MTEHPRAGRPAAAITAAVFALLIAIGFAATRIGVLQGVAPAAGDGSPAPELTGIEAWLNGEPRALADLRGRVVLLDFWTYSCINCIRTLPHLRALHRAYEPFGLTVIGVHAPEFSFERDIANVRAALARHGVAYPVALDNGMQTWRAFGNHWWPHVYLIDAEGAIRYDHIGEGGQDEIQAHVRALMTEAGLRLPPPVRFDRTGPSRGITPEIYAGAERGLPARALANPEGYGDGEVTTYAPVEPEAVEAAGSGSFFLEGPWRIGLEHIEAAGPGARVLVPFRARDVFAVAEGTARVRVWLDGGPLRAEDAGADVLAGVVSVERSDLFDLLDLEAVGEHVLTLEAQPGLRLYAFTFG